jgi:hypothetical protein
MHCLANKSNEIRCNFFLTFVDMGGIVYSAFNGVSYEAINECYFVNSLQISIYTFSLILP